jgi:hypothetical protein
MSTKAVSIPVGLARLSSGTGKQSLSSLTATAPFVLLRRRSSVSRNPPNKSKYEGKPDWYASVDAQYLVYMKQNAQMADEAAVVKEAGRREAVSDPLDAGAASKSAESLPKGS